MDWHAIAAGKPKDGAIKRGCIVRSSPAPGHVIVQDNRTGKVSYWQKDYHQSASDSRGISTADYIHAMYFFLRQVKAKDVLMIGCGGGTLATMLHTKGVKVTIVDIHKLSSTSPAIISICPPKFPVMSRTESPI
jgi:hypothetical protein